MMRRTSDILASAALCIALAVIAPAFLKAARIAAHDQPIFLEEK